MAEHRAARGERSWMDLERSEPEEYAAYPRHPSWGGYGHGQRLAAAPGVLSEPERASSPEGSWPGRAPAWTVHDFVDFMASRHPETGTDWCGCGMQRHGCEVRYGLDMIERRPRPDRR